MPETLEKLTPNRDLQCYFLEPSAIAALSGTSATGYTVSGTWRQQFDWAVIEWNRDNVFEHPAFRNLPDGDLSGLTLTYNEIRDNCIPIDSTLFPTVDWPSLRVWADPGTGEQLYKIPLLNYATPIAGSYTPATVQFTLSGSVTVLDYVGIAFLTEHYPYRMNSGDTLEFAIQNIVAGVNAFSPTMTAVQSGATITLTYIGAGYTPTDSKTGANGNLVGVYTYVSGSMTETWDAVSKVMSGGTSPTEWQIVLPFATLADPVAGLIPASSVRKLRWTYSAAFQVGEYERSEFQVAVSNWTVTGTGRSYSVAGPGSRRIEDNSRSVQYSTGWTPGTGNFSGGTIQSTSTNSSSVTCTYTSAQTHSLYLGTRLADAGTLISVTVDGGTPLSENLNVPTEDVLIRRPLGQFGAGSHRVVATHVGNPGTYFYFDFLEIAIPSSTLPDSETTESKICFATDWDTEHSLALAPERTAWMINSLGMHARVNHYVGALWFYELIRVGHVYASGTITFVGSPDPSLITEIILGRTDDPTQNTIQHLNLIGDTAETLALAFALELNRGYNAVRASASGNVLTIYSRTMGLDGNKITIATSPPTTHLTPEVSGATLANGFDGNWYTDLTVVPRLNRAARDWHLSFFQAIHGYGMDGVAAFSMELGNGDTTVETGIAQRYPSGNAVWLNTPSLQTNFSPASAAFWQQVHLDMANILIMAGMSPYLQFGEVQWWYFPDDGSGMPFYDAYTTSTFLATYGTAMTVITTNSVDPTTIPHEAAFLPGLIGAFTAQIMAFVRTTVPDCRYEVLYPIDVNDTPLNRVINYPTSEWTPAKLDGLKTESFGYTFSRNLDLCATSINAGIPLGFSPSQRSHLVGLSDSSTPWLKETMMSVGAGLESVVLFALDQFCLIGYSLPLSHGARRSTDLS
ncbi:MAG TPA: hypothetical protein VKT81_10950 [Bryobacteraceae bacterium]|nr:hypothetical protein [Bryobacteraceae bacterium]